MKRFSKTEVQQDVEATRDEVRMALHDAGEIWSGKNAIASAWRSTKGKYYRAKNHISESAFAADEMVQSRIYKSLGVALGAGVLIGYFFTKKSSTKKQSSK